MIEWRVVVSVQTLSAAVSVCAALVALSGVYVARTNAHGQLVNSTLQQLGSDQFRTARRDVYMLGEKPVDQWSEDERLSATATVYLLNQLGFLMKHHYVAARPFLDFWALRFVRLYGGLRPYIEDTRLEHSTEEQWIYFEWLARRSYRHLQQRSRKLWWKRRSWRRLQDSTEGIKDVRVDFHL
jgi:hypothetical protein